MVFSRDCGGLGLFDDIMNDTGIAKGKGISWACNGNVTDDMEVEDSAMAFLVVGKLEHLISVDLKQDPY